MYQLVETETGIIADIAYPDAAKDILAFIRYVEPEFEPRYDTASVRRRGVFDLGPGYRVVERGPGSGGNMRYSEGYVNYLADYAANLYDSDRARQL